MAALTDDNNNISSFLIAIELAACEHKPGSKQIKKVPTNATIRNIFEEIHGQEKGKIDAQVSTNLHSNELYDVNPDLTIGALMAIQDIKLLLLKCCCASAQTAAIPTKVSQAEKVNAFNILMSGAKVPPNRKDEMYNNVVDMFVQRNLKLHRSIVADERVYAVQVVTNALWYLTNHHTTINDAALRFKDVSSIPADFDGFQGYNEIKRKKLKSQPLQQIQLNSHAEAIFSLLSRPVFDSQFMPDLMVKSHRLR
ncbi:hypothetical protein MAR_005012 [Mya arenaria]|uniref:Uncharacterized protein n=1 Tax=Mya arenaria TaxID=6604 RepID=A0ABY7F1E5_MYAAR|nr:hypothetical protein MAR_005012 [Mya arenaria]